MNPSEETNDTWEFVAYAVPNNDLRYELNKLQARRWARTNNVQLLWCPAKDTVGLEALRSDPSLPGKKKQWLGRHDRQCCDLHGMLPLAVGLPMVLMKHFDQSDEVAMLKGENVKMHSIHLHAEDEKASKNQEEYPSYESLHHIINQQSEWQELTKPFTIDHTLLPFHVK